MPEPTTWALVGAWTLVVVGLAGSVLPVLPGVPVMVGGLVLVSWIEGFAYVGPWALVGLAGLGALTYAVDFAAGALGAKRFGASRRAVIGAAVGALVGLFFGLPGILLGPFVGAVLGELSARRTLQEAGRAGIGTTIGLALGAAAKLALTITTLCIYLVLRFF
ncbi:MAG: DUF456 domain-containing protein [Myxococcota bacterium]